MLRSGRSLAVVVAVAFVGVCAPARASTTLNLLSGTGVLASKSGSGPLSSASASTNTFSPAADADYKRFGGEPTGTVDRYPVTSGTLGTKSCSPSSPCFPDFAYVSSPQGFIDPHYSTFFKSSDLGQTFRTTAHFPATDEEEFNAGGGGDSYIAVGQVSHKVFFTDLPAQCVTLNVSTDFGEHFQAGPDACGTTPGTIDDRNWVAVDERFPGDTPPATGHVYVTFINFTNLAAPTLEAQVSTDDGNSFTTAFGAQSSCNAATLDAGSQPVNGGVQAPNGTPTPCPDPADTFLDNAGPPVVDVENTHNVYMPFIRATPTVPGLTAGPPYSLWVARSTDGGATWTRFQVADLGSHDPANIFAEMTVDRGGNLYFTWSQTQGPDESPPDLGGEQDVYYAFSTTRGATWSDPIDITKENGDSAVFPWMVAGDPGQVDLVFYEANTGLNSNVAAVDQNGDASSCDPSSDAGCAQNPSVWNVYFAQTNNALNTGPNFKAVQISAQPNHVGQICTAGLACSTGGNRNLLDFFTVDIDHLGGANVVWADDHNARAFTVNRFSRQLSGNSVYKSTNISLANTWPITDHAVTDPAGDVFDGAGNPKGPCAGMDLLGTSEQRSGDLLTVTLTLNNAPTAAEAKACSPEATGGVWGAELWASSDEGGNNYYIGYRDNPGDGPPHGEAGAVDHSNATATSLEFDPRQASTVGGTCFSGGAPTKRTPCTVVLTTSLPTLGVKPGAGLYDITGLSTYYTGQALTPPLTTLKDGNSEQADAATAFDDNGTGTTK